jgi:hypothetical protein
MKNFVSLAKTFQCANHKTTRTCRKGGIMLVNGMWGLTGENHFGVVV